jgi:hypothetical protein
MSFFRFVKPYHLYNHHFLIRYSWWGSPPFWATIHYPNRNYHERVTGTRHPTWERRTAP